MLNDPPSPQASPTSTRTRGGPHEGAAARARRLLLAAVAFALPLSFCGIASASPGYAPALQAYFALAEAPSCGLCHTTDEGGPGRVNLYVGMYLKTRLQLESGLSDEAFKAVIFRWNAYQDSDGDGAFDVAELRAYADPNDPSVLPGSPKPTPSGSSGEGDDDDDDDEPAEGVRSSGSSVGESDPQGAAAAGCSYAAAEGGAPGATFFVAFAALLGIRHRARRPRRG